MIHNIRLRCCDHKVAWLVILILQLLAISLVIGSVFTPVWASTDDDEFGLYKCNTSCAKSNYKDQRELSCTQIDFAGEYDSNAIEITLKSGCKLFENLERAFYIYIVCAGISLFCTLVWLSTVLIFCSRKVSYACGILFGTLALVSQIIGVVLWSIESKTKFSDCSDFPDDGSAPELCAKEGIKVAIAACCNYFILLLTFIVLGNTIKKQLVLIESQLSRSNSKVSPDGSALKNIAFNNS